MATASGSREVEKGEVHTNGRSHISVDCEQLSFHVVSNHAAVLSTDDLLRRFWEVEELDTKDSSSAKDNILSADEQHVLSHFQREHRRDDFGRFIVPLPWNSEEKPLGESRSLAVRRFLSLERLPTVEG